MWPTAVRIKGFLSYIPDEWDTARKIDRTFFYDIFSTLAYDLLAAIVKDVREQYAQHKESKEKKVTMLNMTKEFMTEMLAHPWESSK